MKEKNNYENNSLNSLLTLLDLSEQEEYKTKEEREKMKEEVTEVLRTKYGLDNESIKNKFGEWVDEHYGNKYKETYCSKCPDGGGLEEYRELFLTKSLIPTPELPKTKKECKKYGLCLWEFKKRMKG